MASPSMRAAVCSGPGEIGLERVPVPEPAEGEVRVRVGACGICGTDLHLFATGYFGSGVTPGHEIAGRVDALGPGADGVTVGDAVAVEPIRSCGRCPACRAGRSAICPDVALLGLRSPGGMADYVTVPAERLFRLPADLSPQLSALAEPMAVVVHGLRRGGIAPGQRVLVLGAGSLGLLTVLAARALGADDVWLTARYEHQARLGAQLGATRVLGEKEASRDGLRALGAEAPVDLTVETVGGHAETLTLAADPLRPGGTVSVLGVFMGPVTLDPFPLLTKEATLAWSNCYEHSHQEADFGTAIDLLDRHRDALGAVATHQVPLDDIARGFELAGAKQSGVVKVTLLPEAG